MLCIFCLLPYVSDTSNDVIYIFVIVEATTITVGRLYRVTVNCSQAGGWL